MDVTGEENGLTAVLVISGKTQNSFLGSNLPTKRALHRFPCPNRKAGDQNSNALVGTLEALQSQAQSGGRGSR